MKQLLRSNLLKCFNYKYLKIQAAKTGGKINIKYLEGKDKNKYYELSISY